MKAETALIIINDETRLKVLLIPENDKELKFLREALTNADDYDVSASLPESEGIAYD